MTKFHWILLTLYQAVAAGFGGWHGKSLFSDFRVLWLFLPPAAWGICKAVEDWRRNPYWLSFKNGLLLALFTVVAIGGQALVLAWLVSESTVRMSANPTVRALVGVGMLAAGMGMIYIFWSFRKPAIKRGPDEHLS